MELFFNKLLILTAFNGLLNRSALLQRVANRLHYSSSLEFLEKIDTFTNDV